MLRTEREFLDDLWCRSVGKKYAHEATWEAPPLQKLRETQRYDRFYQHMCDRLVMGCLRRGTGRRGWRPLADEPLEGYDMIKAIELRLAQLKETDTMELFIDIANYCLLGFIQYKNSGRQMESIDNRRKDLGKIDNYERK